VTANTKNLGEASFPGREGGGEGDSYPSGEKKGELIHDPLGGEDTGFSDGEEETSRRKNPFIEMRGASNDEGRR